MPELEINELHSQSARAYVFAVMNYPYGNKSDHDRHADAVTLEAVRKAFAKRGDRSRDIAQRMPDLLFRVATGPRMEDMIQETRGELWTIRGNLRPFFAATVMLMVMSGRQHGTGPQSKKAAFTLLADIPKRLPFRERSLREAFDYWEPVLHFHAVELLWPNARSKLHDSRQQDGLVRFLWHAESIRVMAEAIALDQGTLLDAALTWKVPASFNLPVAKLILPTISEIERPLRAAFSP
jgi:hypothetical protein